MGSHPRPAFRPMSLSSPLGKGAPLLSRMVAPALRYQHIPMISRRPCSRPDIISLGLVNTSGGFSKQLTSVFMVVSRKTERKLPYLDGSVPNFEKHPSVFFVSGVQQFVMFNQSKKWKFHIQPTMDLAHVLWVSPGLSGGFARKTIRFR